MEQTSSKYEYSNPKDKRVVGDMLGMIERVRVGLEEKALLPYREWDHFQSKFIDTIYREIKKFERFEEVVGELKKLQSEISVINFRKEIEFFHPLRPKCLHNTQNQNLFAVTCPSRFGWDRGQREVVLMRKRLFKRSDFEPFIKKNKDRMLSILAELKTPEQKKEWRKNIKEFNDLVKRDWKAYESYKAHLYSFMETIASDWNNYITRTISDMRDKVLPSIQERWESYATQVDLDLPFRSIHENLILDLVKEFRKKKSIYEKNEK